MQVGSIRRLGLAAAIATLAGALPVHASDGDVTIAISGGKFVPSEVAVPAGQKIKLIVRNEDKSMSEFESSDFHREKVVTPGTSITLYVGPLDAGSYEFFDDFNPDNRGHLVVR
jgi:heme/copper-type cytochrome/quinol oxidase subunit 2